MSQRRTQHSGYRRTGTYWIAAYTIPVSSATAQISLFALRCLKTRLRLTMKAERLLSWSAAERLNSLLLCHTHKNLTDKVRDDAVVNDLITVDDIR